MNPKYPIYIPSKGRWESRLTSKALEKMDMPYNIIVEEQEYDEYARVIDEKKIIVLDKQYQEDYNTCDNLDKSYSKGSGPARNFIWDLSTKAGFKWHWILDDNIRVFLRFNNNRQIPFGDGSLFRCMEYFVSQYVNIAMAGPNYRMFVPKKQKVKPFILNTRIYSCNLIRNDLPFRWRGRYNEDTDLSLRMLKAGWCTILFNAFQQEKRATQRMHGGNTDELYKEGTLKKSQMIVGLHPDVARLAWRYTRPHHYIDYRPFKRNKLIRKSDIEISKDINKYNLKLTKRK